MRRASIWPSRRAPRWPCGTAACPDRSVQSIDLIAHHDEECRVAVAEEVVVLAGDRGRVGEAVVRGVDRVGGDKFRIARRRAVAGVVVEQLVVVVDVQRRRALVDAAVVGRGVVLAVSAARSAATAEPEDVQPGVRLALGAAVDWSVGLFKEVRTLSTAQPPGAHGNTRHLRAASGQRT